MNFESVSVTLPRQVGYTFLKYDIPCVGEYYLTSLGDILRNLSMDSCTRSLIYIPVPEFTGYNYVGISTIQVGDYYLDKDFMTLSKASSLDCGQVEHVYQPVFQLRPRSELIWQHISTLHAADRGPLLCIIDDVNYQIFSYEESINAYVYSGAGSKLQYFVNNSSIKQFAYLNSITPKEEKLK